MCVYVVILDHHNRYSGRLTACLSHEDGGIQLSVFTKRTINELAHFFSKLFFLYRQPRREPEKSIFEVFEITELGN